MSTELATIPEANPSTGSLIAAVIQSGISKENVDVVERLVALKEREDARQAERDFAKDFTALQIETPKITASKAVPDKHGNLKYKFAPYEDIMREVRPLLAKHGFAITYGQDVAEGRVIVTCTLMHRSGHSQTNKFACRIGSGPPGSSEAQGDGAATTYAKRFALCAALGITIESDTDGKNEGDGAAITPEQAADLRLRCEEATPPIDMVRFLKVFNVTSFDDIPAADYGRADDLLRRRAKK